MSTPIGSRSISRDARDNAATLEAELDWVAAVMDARLEQYFSADEDPKKGIDVREVAPPVHPPEASLYAKFLVEHAMGFDERVVLAMAILPHVRPQALDLFFLQNKTLDRPYTEFGGWKGNTHSGFLPTCETVCFVLAGGDLARRLEVLGLFDEEHAFHKRSILRIDHQGGGEPFWSGALRLSNEALNLLTTGQIHKPDYGVDFPAKRITSRLSWSDLVLDPDAADDISCITAWLRHSATVMGAWGMEKNVKPGYRCLFYGPPGTGKTLTATLIGAEVGLDVYRIDLSMVLSKYIGETEKNLSNLFLQAENKNWVLFFDEADALFGKRTAASSSNDRFANQEVSYLLQRIEDFPGLVILASNLKSNIDEAFSRRFQSVVYFPMPEPEQRLRLWEGMFPRPERLGPDVDLRQLADDHELAGGSLLNVARYAALRAVQAGRDAIRHADLVDGIRRELRKEGHTA
jgi:AAA+ superfamily predicted ATPase